MAEEREVCAVIEGKAIAKFGSGDILLTALCKEDREKCCVVMQNKGTHKIGDKVSTDNFKREDDDTLLVFTDIKSIDVLIDKLFEAKLMMKGSFIPNRTIECDY